MVIINSVTNPFIDSLRRRRTMHHINQYKQLTWFLVAYFFYIDGVDTIFTMATVIGKSLDSNNDADGGFVSSSVNCCSIFTFVWLAC